MAGLKTLLALASLNCYITLLDCTKCSYSFVVNEMDPSTCPCLFESSVEGNARKLWPADELPMQLDDQPRDFKSNSIRPQPSQEHYTTAAHEEIDVLKGSIEELQKHYQDMFKQLKDLEIALYKERSQNLDLKNTVLQQEQTLKDYRFITANLKQDLDQYDTTLRQTQLNFRFEHDEVKDALEVVQETLQKHEDYLLKHIESIQDGADESGAASGSERGDTPDMPSAHGNLRMLRYRAGGRDQKHMPVTTATEALCDGISRNATKYKDCDELFERGHHTSGVYYITLDYTPCPIPVYCEMKNGAQPGGWLLIQRRMDGTQNFNRNWTDYRRGFGDLNGEFWLGNDNIFLLSNQASYKLRIDLWDFEDNHTYAEYRYFKVGGERDKYRLLVLNHTGPLADGLSGHSGQLFSTPDEDNDSYSEHHCAREWNAGWWFDRCWFVILNGWYFNQPDVKYRGIAWNHWKSEQLKRSEMKIRPSDYI